MKKAINILSVVLVLILSILGLVNADTFHSGNITSDEIWTLNEASPQPGDWSDIYFCDNTSDDSIIENAVIEYAGKSYGNTLVSHYKSNNVNCL